SRAPLRRGERDRREQPREQAANQLVLADDDLADLLLEGGDDGERLVGGRARGDGRDVGTGHWLQKQPQHGARDGRRGEARRIQLAVVRRRFPAEELPLAFDDLVDRREQLVPRRGPEIASAGERGDLLQRSFREACLDEAPVVILEKRLATIRIQQRNRDR